MFYTHRQIACKNIVDIVKENILIGDENLLVFWYQLWIVYLLRFFEWIKS